MSRRIEPTLTLAGREVLALMAGSPSCKIVAHDGKAPRLCGMKFDAAGTLRKVDQALEAPFVADLVAGGWIEPEYAKSPVYVLSMKGSGVLEGRREARRA